MFHEYRDLISELKQNDTHFSRLFQEHNNLDEEIKNLENDPATATARHEDIELKKRQKLKLKDEIYEILRKSEKK